MMTSMRAVRLTQDGLTLDEVAVPRPSDGEVLVRVCAAAITRGELEWPVDRLPATPSYELSGVVTAVAPDIDGIAAGDEVFALTPFDRDGVASDYAVVPATALAPKPQTLTHVESAALTLSGLSAWQGLFEHGKLRNGERVRVLGAQGGVGHLAAQLAGDSLAGPDERVDLVFDTVGGKALAAAIGSAPRVVSIAEEADGVTYFIVEPNRTHLVELAQRADAGALKPAIDSVFALGDARTAFARVSEHGKHGKVV